MEAHKKLKEIKSLAEIKTLVDLFYNKVKKDEKIGYFFNDIMELSWEEHLPKMYAFWEMMLLKGKSYQGNPFIKHVKVHSKEKLKEEHFERWIKLWGETIDENFYGKKAEEAKFRAEIIRKTLVAKIVNQARSQ